MLQTKNMVKEIKCIYNWLINKLNTAKETNSELENGSRENTQTETQKEKIEHQPRMVRNFQMV